MSGRTTKLLKATLSAMHMMGADRLLAPVTGGVGVIFMLHHVTPRADKGFEPNGFLSITPEFLETVIGDVRDAGFDIISIDDVKARLQSKRSTRPFAVFTLDDGYRDNRDYAYPVFKKHKVPHTIYVPADYADGEGELWWLALERAFAILNEIEINLAGTNHRYALTTDDEKTAAFADLYWKLRDLPEDEARALVRHVCNAAGVDQQALCRELVMNWDELRGLAADPLVTIGAHTLGHYALAKLDDDRARHEMVASIARLEKELGKPCRHFSYPYGCEASVSQRDIALARELGVETAVTTSKGVIRRTHAGHMTALPRLSLNGEFQDSRYVKVLMSGLPFAMLGTAKFIKKPVPATAAAVTAVEGTFAPIASIVSAI